MRSKKRHGKRVLMDDEDGGKQAQFRVDTILNRSELVGDNCGFEGASGTERSSVAQGLADR